MRRVSENKIKILLGCAQNSQLHALCVFFFHTVTRHSQIASATHRVGPIFDSIQSITLSTLFYRLEDYL